ncbi:hypothetical protein ZWY2020_014462 [Hordeum vulgare]|nr:hypothetical protein ZWY2020_014462 [Hordeum vulgare]
MAAIMLCTCSGDQSKFEEMPRSPESLATRDFSANGSSRTGNREATPDDSHVNEVESDLREINYERGNFDAALQVLQGIDIRNMKPVSVSPCSSRRKASEVNGMVMHMSMHSVSLLLEEFTSNAAEECKTIIDIVESAWLNGVPEGTSKECKMIEMFHSTLPKLWMRSGCFEEAFIAYRRALVRPWNLDSQRYANLQKERAVTLLCCGVEVKFPQEFNRQQNMVTPENNIQEEEILLLLVLAVEVLVNHLETLLTGTYSRSEMWYILALFSSATGMDDSALNIIRNGFRVLERKGKPHVPSLLLGAKQTMMSTSHTKKLRLQEEALRLLQEAAAMAKCNPEIMYSFAWENAMQRELNATVENATECLEMVMGGSVIAWKLLNIVLSLHQNFQEAEGVVNIAIDEAEKDDQLDILRLKAQIKASRGQFKRAVESFRVLLATIQAKKEVWKSTTCSEVKSLRKLEMDAWSSVGGSIIAPRSPYGVFIRPFDQSRLRPKHEPTSHGPLPDLGLVLKSKGSLLEAVDYFQAAYELRELSPIQDFSEKLPIMLH